MGVRRRRWLVVVGVLALLAVVWAPSFVATRYTTTAQPIDFLTRPDKGWRFLYDAARISRKAKLGTEGAALAAANHRWRPVDRVELVYLEHPVIVPVAPGAVTVPERARTVRPRSRLTWFVYGRLGKRPRQVVGLLDAVSGKAIWDIRRATPRRSA